MNTSKKIIYFLAVVALCAGSVFTGYAIVQGSKEKIYTFDPGNYFVTNITDSRYLLKSDLVIEVVDKNHYSQLCRNTYKVRDIIINELRSKSYDEVKNPNIQGLLKKQVKERIFEKLNGVIVTDIHFGEFVVQ